MVNLLNQRIFLASCRFVACGLFRTFECDYVLLIVLFSRMEHQFDVNGGLLLSSPLSRREGFQVKTKSLLRASHCVGYSCV